MNIAIPDRFQLAADFEQRANNVSFPAEVWNVAAELAEANEAITPSELEVLTGLSFNQVREALKQLLAKKLVRQDLFTWKQFTAAREEARSAAKAPVESRVSQGAAKASMGGVSRGAAATAPPAQPVTPAISVAIKPAQSQATVSAAPAASAGNGAAVPALRLGSIFPQQAAGVSTNAWVSQKQNSAQAAVVSAAQPGAQQPAQSTGAPSDGRLLRPLLAQIENLKGGGVEGQLLVYQVFLRVPYQLLYDEGIKSLHFVDERTVIKNPALLAAIVKAAKDVAGVDLV